MSNPYRPQSAEILNDVWDSTSDSLRVSTIAGGTAAAPSSDVQTVQYPNAYVGKATLAAINQALTVDTLGAAQIAFHFPQGTVSTTVTIEGSNSNAATPVWTAMKFIRPSPPGAVSNLSYVGTGTGQSFGSGDIVLVSCAGHNQIRCRVITYSSAFEVLASRLFSPGLNHVFCELSNQTTLPVDARLNTAIQYTDTVAPLAANATFTGSSRTMAVGNNKFVAYTVADQLSATDGFRIQSSVDNTNWFPIEKATSATISGTGSCIAKLSADRDTSFYRVSLVNGASGQSILRVTSSQIPG